MIKLLIRVLRRLIKFLILGSGIYIDKVTPYRDVASFIALLKPYNSNHELIRLGGDTDGGYLIPNDLGGVDTCFSPGVSTTSNFENDLTKKGIRCFLADFSVAAPPINNPLFDFEKKYLGIYNDETYITLDSWIAQKAPDNNEFLLQMDIEGAEYAVILNTAEATLKKFRILVIEFHDLDALYSRGGYELVSLTFRKLLKYFQVVHIHPNNCCGVAKYKDLEIPRVMEFTFLRNDRITKKTPARDFPNLLDRKNVIGGREIILPRCWY